MSTASSSTQRSQLLFAFYFELGPERSLASLVDHLTTLGIHFSLSTLKRYSSRDRWAERVMELDARAARRLDGGNLRTKLALHDRQAQRARALQGAGGAALQQLITDTARIREMKPADIARLLELGMRAEREASHQSGDRRRLALAMANLVTEEVVALFERVNTVTDEGSRARAFADGLDALVDEHLKAEEAQ